MRERRKMVESLTLRLISWGLENQLCNLRNIIEF